MKLAFEIDDDTLNALGWLTSQYGNHVGSTLKMLVLSKVTELGAYPQNATPFALLPLTGYELIRHPYYEENPVSYGIACT